MSDLYKINYIHIMTKICNKCNVVKDIEMFYKDKSIKSGYRNKCKECMYLENKDCIKTSIKKYKCVENKTCKGCGIEKDINMFNKDKTSTDGYRHKCKICTNMRKNLYEKNKKEIDLNYKFNKNVRTLMCMSFKRNGYTKNSKTFNIIGLAHEEFKEYIINQFEDWMTLENHGIYTGNYNETWQIDHIEPISNGLTEQELIRLNHFTNLRPLCSRKNLEKSNKFTSN